MIKNKYTVLFGALAAQLTIAGLYAWSIFSTAIVDERAWTDDQVLITYSIAQFVFAFSTIFSGKLVDKKGPRITLMIGGLLYGGGLMLSSLATTPSMLYLTYGVIAGAGVGFVYVCPLSTLIKWFPNNKGTITGLSVAVFGGGSIIFKEVISKLLENYDVAGAFLILGLISMIIIVIGAQFVSLPEGFEKTILTKTKNDFTTKEMIRTTKFKKIWFMYWLAVIPGLLVLGAAKNIGLDANLGVAAAASLVSILAISNASSRLLSGYLSDKLGTLNVLKGVFVITIISLLSIGLFADVTVLFYLGIIGIAVGYGGFLALFPTFTNQQFGSFRYGANYGIVYQAYGLAALSGIFIKTIAGSYTNTFIISAVAGTIGLIIAFSLKESKQAAV
ncbi:MAG: OFA family MFS transporter [Candidatus Izemoplasma sp.]